MIGISKDRLIEMWICIKMIYVCLWLDFGSDEIRWSNVKRIERQVKLKDLVMRRRNFKKSYGLGESIRSTNETIYINRHESAYRRIREKLQKCSFYSNHQD